MQHNNGLGSYIIQQPDKHIRASGLTWEGYMRFLASFLDVPHKQAHLVCFNEYQHQQGF